jgi:hypothetical protein
MGPPMAPRPMKPTFSYSNDDIFRIWCIYCGRRRRRDHDFEELQDLRDDQKGRRQTLSVGEARQMRDRGFAGLLGPTGQGILGFILMA